MLIVMPWPFDPHPAVIDHVRRQGVHLDVRCGTSGVLRTNIPASQTEAVIGPGPGR